MAHTSYSSKQESFPQTKVEEKRGHNINASSSQLGHCKPLLVAQVQQTTRRCNHDVHIISLQTIDIITWAAVELSGWPFDTGESIQLLPK